MNNSGQSCIDDIANCALGSRTDTVFTCNSCLDGFVITDNGNGVNTCENGTVDNCKTYSDALNCNVCSNGFIAFIDTNNNNRNLCKAHITIEQCDIYSTSNADACTSCNVGYLNFTKTTTCQTVDAAFLVSNCAGYNHVDSKCSSCLAGYFLTTEPKCELISDSSC